MVRGQIEIDTSQFLCSGLEGYRWFLFVFPPVFSKFSAMNWHYFCIQKVIRRNMTQKHKRAI